MKNRTIRVQTKYRKINNSFSLNKNILHTKIKSNEPEAVTHQLSLTWEKAKDFIVYDDKGNQWIDLTSGIFVANAGHANPQIKKAVIKQLNSDLFFSYNYPTKIKQQMLEKLLGLSPKYFDKVILLNSGSEAVDAAYKLIRNWGRLHNRKYIVTFNGNYHGRGLANDLICGSKDKASWSGVQDRNVVFLDFPYKETDKFDPTKLPPADQIAAFFLETFQGWGAWFYPEKYINDLYCFARKNNCLVCFDEMQSGFYRMGPLYGYMTYGKDIKPDIICLGKGISSSLPVSAVLSRKDIVEIDKNADLHGTQSGNPICCAAVLANLKFLSDKRHMKRMQKVMEVFQTEIKKLADFALIKQINVRGMIAGLIFDNGDLATNIVMKCVNEGILPVCTFRNSIKIAPPLTISEDAVYEAVSVIRNAIQEVSGEQK